jgi:carbon-monoxide dehydrogenase large subunit
MEATTAPPGGSLYVGQAIKRKEDPRFITGTGRYVDDISPTGTLHAAIVRSPEAHATISSIDVTEAREHPNVVAVFTGDDLAGEFKAGAPMVWHPPGVEIKQPDHWPLKSGEVKCVGDPVAVVVARDRYIAVDAAEKVIVEYDPKPAVVDPEAALEDGAPLVWDQFETNKSHEWAVSGGDIDDALASADVVLERRVVNHRTAGAAIEARGAVAEPHGDSLTIYSSTQIPHILRFQLAGMLGMAEDKIRVVAPDVGGGFGTKLNVYGDEALLCVLARRLGRPVKWIETRSENLAYNHHGRDQIAYVTIGATSDGTLTGLRVRMINDLGAYQQLLTPFIPVLGFPVMGGCYRFPAIDLHFTGVFTNKFATDAIRGAGRPEATHYIEVAMDQLAYELGIDRLELRRKNFIGADQFPYETPVGIVYDSGNYEGTLDKLLEHVEVDTFRREQEELRADGIYRGIGFSTYVEVCGLAPSRAVGPQNLGLHAAFYESAAVRVHPTGSATVYSGASPHGQGLDTSYAQIAADRLGLSPEDVEVLHGDTNAGPWGWGTYGSRSISVGGEAVARAAERVQEKAKRVCAAMLEAAPEDIELTDGKFRVKGSPDKAMSMAEIALASYVPPDELPTEIEPGLEESAFYDPENFVFPFGAHACVVDVDIETGKVKVARWVAVDDCGPAINPMLIESQVHGGVVHGIGQALYEQIVYDSEGQLVTGSFVDYALPTAAELPSLETDRTETPSPVNSLGVKGVGEAGTIAASPAVLNAVVDALRPLGVDYIDMPLTPMRVWEAINAARSDGGGPAASEQGVELGEHGQGAAGSGPARPKEGGAS